MSYLFKKIVTHDTKFHADEVIGIALLRCAGHHTDIERTRDQERLREALADPRVLVLDVGGEFNPKMFNFDHHQDAALPSSAGMIWDQVKDSICPVNAQPFFGEFIASIDAMDTNRENIYARWNALPSGFRGTTELIGAFNRDVKNPDEQNFQFFNALDFAQTVVANELHIAKERAREEEVYKRRRVLSNNVAVFDDYCDVWRSKGEHQFAIIPHATGWKIQSADSSVAVVPESVCECEGFIFRHASGFMATVKKRETAIKFAAQL